MNSHKKLTLPNEPLQDQFHELKDENGFTVKSKIKRLGVSASGLTSRHQQNTEQQITVACIPNREKNQNG